MPRGRPRKPTSIKILTGSFRKDRDGNPAEEPAPVGIPQKPANLKGRALDFWNRVVPKLVELTVATALDAPALESMCIWWAREQDAQEHLDGMESDLIGSSEYYRVSILAGHARKQWESIANRFGLTPSDRARLRIEKPAKRTGVAARQRHA